MAKQSKKSTKSRTAREQAAAARAEALAAEKRRQRTINIVIAVVITVVVVGIVGGALYFANQTKEESGAVADPDAPRPEGAFSPEDPLAYGIPTGTDPDAPTLEVWEDFQCPACGAFEEAVGADLDSRAAAGEIVLVSRPTTFLDRSLGNDSSRLATSAYGCAVDAGQGSEYKSIVFANQPGSEGDGWTEEQLVGFAESAGIVDEDLATFETCLTDRVYLPWATNSTEEFYANGVGGTPTVLLNGETIETADVLDPEVLSQLIAEAAGQQ